MSLTVTTASSMRLGDQRVDGFGACARIHRGDHHDGEVERGQQVDAELGPRDQADDQQRADHHQHEQRTADGDVGQSHARSSLLRARLRERASAVRVSTCGATMSPSVRSLRLLVATSCPSSMPPRISTNRSFWSPSRTVWRCTRPSGSIAITSGCVPGAPVSIASRGTHQRVLLLGGDDVQPGEHARAQLAQASSLRLDAHGRRAALAVERWRDRLDGAGERLLRVAPAPSAGRPGLRRSGRAGSLRRSPPARAPGGTSVTIGVCGIDQRTRRRPAARRSRRRPAR